MDRIEALRTIGQDAAMAGQVYAEGQRVRLLPQPEDGAPEEETGTVLEYEGNGLYCVRLDPEFIETDPEPLGDGIEAAYCPTFDDGLREVDEEFIREVAP